MTDPDWQVICEGLVKIMDDTAWTEGKGQCEGTQEEAHDLTSCLIASDTLKLKKRWQCGKQLLFIRKQMLSITMHQL